MAAHCVLCVFVFVCAVKRSTRVHRGLTHTPIIIRTRHLSHFILWDHRPCACFVVVFLFACWCVSITNKQNMHTISMWASPRHVRAFILVPLVRNLNTQTQKLWFDLLCPDYYTWDFLVWIKTMLEYCGWRTVWSCDTSDRSLRRMHPLNGDGALNLPDVWVGVAKEQ